MFKLNKGRLVILKKEVPSIAKVSSMLLAHGEANWTVWMDCNGVKKPVEGLVFNEETHEVTILNEDS